MMMMMSDEALLGLSLTIIAPKRGPFTILGYYSMFFWAERLH